MIKLLSFKLRDNIDLKQEAEAKLGDTAEVTNIEIAGIDKDTIWVVVRATSLSQRSFNQVDGVNFPAETKQKTFSGGGG